MQRIHTCTTKHTQAEIATRMQQRHRATISPNAPARMGTWRWEEGEKKGACSNVCSSAVCPDHPAAWQHEMAMQSLQLLPALLVHGALQASPRPGDRKTTTTPPMVMRQGGQCSLSTLCTMPQWKTDSTMHTMHAHAMHFENGQETQSDGNASATHVQMANGRSATANGDGAWG